MEENQQIAKWTVGSLQILIFNIMGVRFGVDMEQIDEMLEPAQFREQQIPSFHLHEWISFRMIPVVYNDPRVLIVKFREKLVGIGIDQPESIIELGVESINLFPPLLERCKQEEALWATASLNGQIILLVDLFKLTLNHFNPAPAEKAG